MEKPTKRKAFNFLRSYFDVVNELEKDTDKLNFLMSIINKQFLDEDPKDLTFLVNLCYSSQKHSIESSVKGWKRASNTDMHGNPLTDPQTPLGANPSTNPKEEEEKEEEKVEEEVKEQTKELEIILDAEIIYFSFDDFWSLYPNKTNKANALKSFNKIPKEDLETLEIHLNHFINNKPFKEYSYPHATTYLNQQRYKDELITNNNNDGKQIISSEQHGQIIKIINSDGVRR